MNERATSAWFFGALPGFGLPALLAFVLNLMRPDLMQPMLDHVFGYALVAAIALLSTLGTALYGLGFGGNFKTRTARVILIVCTALFVTLPTIFAMLFGPIVFAFMFGTV